jgi:hypothetical protein
VHPEIYDDDFENAGSDYEYGSDSDMSENEGLWELCYERRAEWQYDLLKHLEDEGNNDVCTMSLGSRD